MASIAVAVGNGHTFRTFNIEIDFSLPAERAVCVLDKIAEEILRAGEPVEGAFVENSTGPSERSRCASV